VGKNKPAVPAGVMLKVESHWPGW